MSFEYDAASNALYLTGTATGATMDGTAFTAVLDSNTYYAWKSCTFSAQLATAIAYSAAAWVVQDSDDNVTYAAADADALNFPKPADLATTSKSFHIGYMGKKRYVKAAFTSGGPTGQINIRLGHPQDAPTFQSAITGIEG